jgi:hypothetical protein
MYKCIRLFVLTGIIFSLNIIPFTPRAAQAAGSVIISSPNQGATITGPVRISGTYTNAYSVVISFNAGQIYDVHMEDSDANESGTWYYDWTPAGFSGNVEICVRATNIDDRYWTWAPVRTVNVSIAAQQPPVVAIVSPGDGATASGIMPITVAASDAQGLASVQVRIDWESWQTASFSGGNYAYNWNTSGLGNKTHAIEARATDTNGNVTTTLINYIKTGTGTSEPPTLKQTDRAMWLWETDAAQLIESPGARNVLAHFMDDPAVSSHRVRTIYFYADQYDGGNLLQNNPALYRNFIAWAHGRGYYVHALVASGSYLSPAYAYNQYHDKARGLIEDVLNYNISSASNEQFDGINIDIEPYVIGEWSSRAPSLQIQYFDMLDKMMQRKVASGQNLNVGAAIPRWYDVAPECTRVTWKGNAKPCNQHVQDTLDYVSIMDYKDYAAGAGGIITDGQNEINYGDTIGKKVIIGVETSQISARGDPEVISFQEEGRTYMEGQLDQVYTAFGSNSSFLGIVVHHRDSYRRLPSVWSSSGTTWQPSVADSANPPAPGGLTASAWDWQRIDLHWNRVNDDTEVDYYEVHRSKSSNFTPRSSTLARKSLANSTSDWGLLASTTYYYKVIAVDVFGKKSAASVQASATTPAGVGLLPLKIQSVTIQCNANNASGKVKVVTSSGTALGAVKVVGHWEGAAGKKFSGWTANNSGNKGNYQSSSESLSRPYRVIIAYERLMKSGYYWATSLDAVHTSQIDCN